MSRLTTVAAGLALSMVFAGQAAAQDVTPPVSQDTSKAEKIRPDTLREDTTRGYRAMVTPNPCVLPADEARARDAAKLEPGRDMARADTMGPAIIRRDSIPGDPAPTDTLAAVPGAEQEQPQQDSLRVGVMADSVRPDSEALAVAYPEAVDCDTMGQMTPATPVDTAEARDLPGIMGDPAPTDTTDTTATPADPASADKPKDQ